ncbi:MAG: alpha/beta hydrolase [Sphingomonadaceae bacterium]|uniref:alpha/beta fold hydrolase n=1 Tax=Thermaurantiacus sp. TaxID=2820283 RepID=UPI00298F2494|nr:alpha/beta hydrolase [Thermaurantiacus sp.]MCS6986400.1 alpha/beta hydrolase [Sphingomonadaceae bacterium]MDW8414339.1 alpha/beta hydrolase [Thermaurantiacus sp.]
MAQSMRVMNDGVGLHVELAGPEGAPGLPILCVHGWPELAHSWRHQLAHFAALGRRIAALDVRGYGRSDKPWPVEAYRMSVICSDIAAVIDALGGRAILFGHDWGAPIVYHTALRYPEKVAAVAGLSVPYAPVGDVSFLDMARQIYKDRFFYQLYFQEEGKAEMELGGDPLALHKIYFGISASKTDRAFLMNKPPSAGLLDGIAAPERLPDWMPEADMTVFVRAFREGGWRGPINRYRAQDLDFREREPVKGRRLAQPHCFIGGEFDIVRHFVPGVDLYADPGQHADDFRGSTIVPRAGHWVQQEAPEVVNRALEAFVASLEDVRPAAAA